MESLTSLVVNLIFYGMLYSLLFSCIDLLKQHYIRKLCRSNGTPGPACVICAYHHDCVRAKQSEEYKLYSYCRRVVPDRAKELFDEIWAEEEARSKNANE